MDPEREEIVSADEVGRDDCHMCGMTVKSWRMREIDRPHVLVTLFYCTACGEFVWGFRSLPRPERVHLHEHS